VRPNDVPSVTSPGSAADRRERVGWYFYDFANSAFSTSVVTVFLGPYLTAVARTAGDAEGFVYPLGVKVAAGSFFPYVVSLSVLLQVVLLPFLGAVADYSRRKKHMLLFFAYLGAFATMGLYFLRGTNYLLGGSLYVIANISFGAAVVLYNAFLPEIATSGERDSVSSKGWALGYLGGGMLLALNLLLVSQAAAIGLSTEQAVRISLASAGAWWAVFTLLPMAALRTRQPVKTLPPGEHLALVGLKHARRILGSLRRYPQTLLFLVAHLLYNDGVQTVITLASQFGQEELGLPMSTLAIVVLMVQFVAVLGAVLFDYVARAVGAKRAIVVSLVIWIGVVVYAYGFLRTATQFFVLGAAIAIVLGGTQALSRSLYSLMIPRGREAEYFSVYEISERGASWMGPLLFGLALQFAGSYRVAILSVAIFLLSGLSVLSRVDVRRAAGEAGNEVPLRA
jgi:UMF1 family MFS transporter